MLWWLSLPEFYDIFQSCPVFEYVRARTTISVCHGYEVAQPTPSCPFYISAISPSFYPIMPRIFSRYIHKIFEYRTLAIECRSQIPIARSLTPRISHDCIIPYYHTLALQIAMALYTHGTTFSHVHLFLTYFHMKSDRTIALSKIKTRGDGRRQTCSKGRSQEHADIVSSGLWKPCDGDWPVWGRRGQRKVG